MNNDAQETGEDSNEVNTTLVVNPDDGNSNHDEEADLINQFYHMCVLMFTMLQKWRSDYFIVSNSHSRDHNYQVDPVKDSPEVISHQHICSQSIYLDLKIRKANETIKKLQNKVQEKTTTIGRLRSALKRVTLSKSNLKEVLDEIKEKKMISEEGFKSLQVNIFTL